MTDAERELLLLLVDTVAWGSKHHHQLYDLAKQVREDAKTTDQTLADAERR